MLKGSVLNKSLVGFIAGVSMLMGAIVPAFAASGSTTVYVTKTGSSYHSDGCSELGDGAIKTNLQTAESMGYTACSKCDASTLSSSGSNSTKSNDADSESKSNKKNDSKTETTEVTETTVTTTTVTTENENGEVETYIVEGDTVEATIGDNDSKSSSKSTTTTTSNSSSKSSSKSSKSNSSSSSNGLKTLMTEKQRKAKFKSVTNPKKGERPVSLITRPANVGYLYADFGTYNDYASKNGLGGTPIYLLGTVMDMQPVSDGGSYYGTAIMVNDCDGYQWYMRLNVAKDKYDMLRNEIVGKQGYIYGAYSGYSGVTNRPMMDATMMIEIGGAALNLALYQ